MGAQNMMKLMCIVIVAYARADDNIDAFVDEFPAEVETEFVEEMTECPAWCTDPKARRSFLRTGVIKKVSQEKKCKWKKCFGCTGWLDKCPSDLKVKKGGHACTGVSESDCKAYATKHGKSFRYVGRTSIDWQHDSCFVHFANVYWGPTRGACNKYTQCLCKK